MVRLTHSLSHLHTHSLTHSPTLSLTHSPSLCIVWSLPYSLSRSLTHSLSHVCVGVLYSEFLSTADFEKVRKYAEVSVLVS